MIGKHVGDLYYVWTLSGKFYKVSDLTMIPYKEVYHRAGNRPSLIGFRDGRVFQKIFTQNGNYHCLNGASIRYYSSGGENCIYYIKGKKYTKNEYEDAILIKKLELQ